MEDLTGQINAILSDPQAMEQIKGLAASLGLQGTPESGVETQGTLAESPSPPPQTTAQGEGSSPDLSGLLAGLGGLLGNSEPAAPPSPPSSGDKALQSSGNGGGLNLSALAGLLGNGNKVSTSPSGSSGGAGLLSSLGNLGSLGALAGLGGSTGTGAESGGLLQGDLLPMIMKVAPFISPLQQETDSPRLLRALRPMISSSRQKKLDEAIRMMQLMRILPLLKGKLF